MEYGQWLSKEEYEHVFEKVPRLCVDLVIRTDEGVLLTLRDIEPYKGEWHLPGGRVLKRETLPDAVRRIAKAETGLEVEVVRELGHMEFLDEPTETVSIHTVSIAFLVRPLGGELKIDRQGSEGRFFKELPENTVGEQMRFLKALNLL